MIIQKGQLECQNNFSIKSYEKLSLFVVHKIIFEAVPFVTVII